MWFLILDKKPYFLFVFFLFSEIIAIFAVQSNM